MYDFFPEGVVEKTLKKRVGKVTTITEISFVFFSM